MQETERKNGCMQNEKGGFQCSYNMGEDFPQTIEGVEEATQACFQALTQSCNNQRGGTSCRWAARFTCRSILDRARATLMNLEGESEEKP